MGLFSAGQNNVAAWGLASGSRTTDTGGDGNGLTLTEVGTLTAATGFKGGSSTAASGFSSANYLNIADTNALDVTRITMSAWVYITSASATSQFVISKTGATRSYELYLNNAGVYSLISISGTDVFTNGHTTAPAINGWTHIAATYDGANVTTYVNGVASTPTACTGNINNSTANLRIGNRANGTANPVNGTIDDVAIWSRALSASEISALYTSYVEGFTEITTGTIAATLAGASVSATGGQTTGTIGATLAGASVAIVCNQLIPIGTIAATLEGASVSVAAAIKNIATIAATLEGATVSVNAAVPTTATIGVTLAGASVQVIGATSTVVENFECKVRHKTTGAGITGLTTVKMKAWQPSTGLRFDFADNAFRTTPATPELTLSEVDAVNDPGLYRGLVTTTLWSGWVSMEITYNDGTYTYSYPGEASYISGVRASGHWLPAEAAQITELQTDADLILAALAARLPAALIGGKMDSNVGSVNGIIVTGAGTSTVPWGPV